MQPRLCQHVGVHVAVQQSLAPALTLFHSIKAAPRPRLAVQQSLAPASTLLHSIKAASRPRLADAKVGIQRAELTRSANTHTVVSKHDNEHDDNEHNGAERTMIMH